MAIIESGSIPSLPRSPQLQKTMPREDFPAPDRTKPHQNNGGIPCDSCQMDPNALGLFLFSLLLILSEGHTILEAIHRNSFHQLEASAALENSSLPMLQAHRSRI